MVTIYDFYFVINGFVKKKKRKFYMSKKDPNPLPLILLLGQVYGGSMNKVPTTSAAC